MDTKENILICLLIVLIIFIICTYALIYDFYKDYKCSTTQDMNWFNSNNCLKYSR